MIAAPTLSLGSLWFEYLEDEKGGWARTNSFFGGYRCQLNIFNVVPLRIKYVVWVCGKSCWFFWTKGKRIEVMIRINEFVVAAILGEK